ncbi:unnamed protein product [Lymnaea stagnalis]|uniref:Coiled-coil SMC6 And NSE5 INteracting (CANIN) domain-containing protein n=1 Tax=Lymnaea stagnalis TaxID=6523 RepID=A0AAV2I291_LYMST
MALSFGTQKIKGRGFKNSFTEKRRTRHTNQIMNSTIATVTKKFSNCKPKSKKLFLQSNDFKHQYRPQLILKENVKIQIKTDDGDELPDLELCKNSTVNGIQKNRTRYPQRTKLLNLQKTLKVSLCDCKTYLECDRFHRNKAASLNQEEISQRYGSESKNCQLKAYSVYSHKEPFLSNRKRITSERQAVSSCDTLCSLIVNESSVSSNALIQNYKPKAISRRRISDERQAFSTPVTTINIPISTIFTPKCSTKPLQSQGNLLNETSHDISSECSEVLQDIHCIQICGDYIKDDHSLRDDSICTDSPIKYSKLKRTPFHFSEESREALKSSKEWLDICQCNKNDFKLSQEMANLKRNVVFGPYISSFLPVHSVQKSTSNFTFYHEQFIIFALEDVNMELASICLENFASYFAPSKCIISSVIRSWIDAQKWLKPFQTSAVLHSISTVYQKYPECISVTEDHLYFCVTSKANDPISIPCLTLLLTALELDLYTRNLCDAVKICHSYAYLLLSWDKGRKNFLLLLQELKSLLSATDSSFEMDKLIIVQRLISLGLNTSIKDMNNAVRNVAREIAKIYCSLPSIDEKTLLLSTIEIPSLTAQVTHCVIEDLYTVQTITSPCPSLKNIADSYFNPFPKQVSPDVKPAGWDEFIVLLYYNLWATIQSIRYKSYQTTRSRVLNPSLEEPAPLEMKTDIDRFLQHLTNMKPHLTQEGMEYCMLIECLLDAVDCL